MKKFLGYVWMWLGSFVVALGFAYGAGTLIKNFTQTATKGDVITSDWVNEVNKKINGSDYFFSKGTMYGYCIQNVFKSRDSHIVSESCSKATYPATCNGKCGCTTGFTLVKMGTTVRDTNLFGTTFTCLKN